MAKFIAEGRNALQPLQACAFLREKSTDCRVFSHDVTAAKLVSQFFVGNFRSVRTVRVVYHLPKISGLSRHARLDSSYNMKLVRNSRNL